MGGSRPGIQIIRKRKAKNLTGVPVSGLLATLRNRPVAGEKKAAASHTGGGKTGRSGATKPDIWDGRIPSRRATDNPGENGKHIHKTHVK